MLTNYDLQERCQLLAIPLNGVFSKDQLPPTLQPGGYIINLQDHDEGFGTHWVALAVKSDQQWSYFDSFGFPPPRAIRHRGRTVEYSAQHIQNINSGVCGSYCLAFLWWIFQRRGTLRGFLSQFSSDPRQNRRILQDMLRPL